ncbi:hypothetical protein HPB51_004399 [Rhipicephalus microplus]|uniref:Uncharacterized protein n=1 Tax=Rhipicephalus microplus TaxID=6941 RepID=A0A9J6ELD4_RHIMP|nr:hypothetical protein HPB51_004399 [Rhipicephalus microplus]
MRSSLSTFPDAIRLRENDPQVDHFSWSAWRSVNAPDPTLLAHRLVPVAFRAGVPCERGTPDTLRGAAPTYALLAKVNHVDSELHAVLHPDVHAPSKGLRSVRSALMPPPRDEYLGLAPLAAGCSRRQQASFLRSCETSSASFCAAAAVAREKMEAVIVCSPQPIYQRPHLSTPHHAGAHTRTIWYQHLNASEHDKPTLVDLPTGSYCLVDALNMHVGKDVAQVSFRSLLARFRFWLEKGSQRPEVERARMTRYTHTRAEQSRTENECDGYMAVFLYTMGCATARGSTRSARKRA